MKQTLFELSSSRVALEWSFGAMIHRNGQSEHYDSSHPPRYFGEVTNAITLLTDPSYRLSSWPSRQVVHVHTKIGTLSTRRWNNQLCSHDATTLNVAIFSFRVTCKTYGIRLVAISLSKLIARELLVIDGGRRGGGPVLRCMSPLERL